MGIRTVRARLTLWYISVLTGTFLLLGGAGYGLLAYSLSRDVDAALTAVARTLAKKSRAGFGPVVPSEIDEVFRRFFGFSPMDRYYDMLDPRGHPESRGSPSAQRPLSREAIRKASEGVPVFETIEGLGPYPVRVLTFPVIEAGHITRLIQVGMSLESLHVTRHRYLLILAMVLPVGLLLAGGGGWLLARRALKPVDRMTETARRISGERLAERLEETGSGDELDKLAQTLNEMLGRLDAAFQQIRQFSADASHELQTPLTILKGEIEVALRSPRKAEEYRQILTSALEEIDRVAQLVEGLLLLARADAGVLRMDDRPVELGQLVEEVLEQTRGLADIRGIHLRKGALEPFRIRGDRERIKRLLLNLVDNGIKYTPPGGQVTVSLGREGMWASVRIEDTGIGMSAEEQAHIFQRFYRAAEARSRDRQGSGLGLCIAQSIAEAHGGRVEVESRLGQGSTFRIRLPLSS